MPTISENNWITLNSKKDQFTYGSVPIGTGFQYSNRNLLRKMSSLFNLVVFLTPYVTRAKVLVEDIWISRIGWDEELNKEC